jgi:hypothetical protein
LLCRGQVRPRSVYIFLLYFVFLFFFWGIWKVKLILLSVQNVATYTNFKYCKLSYTAGHYFFKGWSYSMCLDQKCTKCQSVCSRKNLFCICYLLTMADKSIYCVLFCNKRFSSYEIWFKLIKCRCGKTWSLVLCKQGPCSCLINQTIHNTNIAILFWMFQRKIEQSCVLIVSDWLLFNA